MKLIRIYSVVILLILKFPVLAQYEGGNAGGSFMAEKLLTLCQQILYSDIYKGGIEDGHNHAFLYQINCSEIIYSNVFTGGNEGGTSSIELMQASCLNPVYASIYSGGIEDGNHSVELFQTTCQPPVYAGIFSGGVDDGFSAYSLYQTQCVEPSYAGIFKGGIEDGFSVSHLKNTQCSEVVYASIYQGGIDDGFSFGGLKTACAPHAYFIANQVSICQGQTVQFTDFSLGNPISWSWSFPGGSPSTSTQQHPLVTYNTPGTYDVSLTITSAYGTSTFIRPAYITVYPSPQPVVTLNGPTTFCEGDSVMLSCQPAFLSYQWNSGHTSQHIYASQSGIYQLTVTDHNNCQGTSNAVSLNVLSAPVPQIYVAGPSPACVGDTLVLTSSVALSYLWFPTGDTTQNINVTTSNTYWVSVTYANGCTRISDPITLPFGNTPQKPVITPLGPLNFCQGDSVILQSSPAPGYLWYPGNQQTQSIVVSSSGIYFVEAIDPVGCSSLSDPIEVTVLQAPPIPIIYASGPTTFCQGDSVVLTSSPSANYYWYPGGQTTQSIVVTQQGTYYVQVDNGNGCKSLSQPVTVTVLSQALVPIISANGPTTFCAGDSVVLTSSISGSYLWHPGGETTQSITVFQSGVYFVEVDMGNGCKATSVPVQITVLPQTPVPAITASGPTTFCDGGSVTLTSSPALNYQWYPDNQNTQSIVVTQSGTYYVQVDNGNGCPAISQPIQVTVLPQTPVPAITASGPTTFCDGGSVTLTSSPALNYQWYPDNQNTQSIVVTQSGTYYVQVDNGNGCPAISQPIQVTVLPVPQQPVIYVQGNTTLCAGDSVQLISSALSGNTWYPGGQQTQSIWVSSSGTYWTVVTNPQGCSAQSDPVTITVYSIPVASISGNSIVCAGTTEQYTVQNQYGVNYLWTVSNGIISGGTGTNSIQVLWGQPGNSSVTVLVVDTLTGCSSTHQLDVQSLPAPIAFAGPDREICYGDTIQLEAFGGVSYSWIPAASLSDPNISNPLAWPTVTTLYIVEVTTGICTDRDSILVTVRPLPSADAGPDVTIQRGECVQLFASGGNYYVWSPSTGLNSTTTPTPLACPDETITYMVQVTDQFGCRAVDFVTVIVQGSVSDIVIPNTFTPNGDGINDIWVIDGIEFYPNNKLTVFNRWGNKVFEAKPYNNDWNGESLGKPLPDGTYFFVLDLGDGTEPIKAYVTILR